MRRVFIQRTKPSTMSDWIDELENTQDDQTYYDRLMRGIYNSRMGRDYWWGVLIAKVEDDAFSADEVLNHSQKEIKDHIKKIAT